MRLLIVTQVVDSGDLYLGFFTRWLEEFAPHFEGIEVICLKEGTHALPENVHVYSLGKERGRRPPFVYAFRFLALAWRQRGSYDAAFVHMNQEYVLIAGWFWNAMGKRVYMWRNHYAGTWLTDIAAVFCTKVFCTSRYSYTAKYRKTVLMPVGVDTARFGIDARIERRKNSVLFFARMAPSKDPLLLLEALRQLSERNVPFSATFVGSPLPQYEAYYRNVLKRAERYGLTDRVTFLPGVPNTEAPALYQEYEIFVNCARSGMLDKMIFEAAASGCLVLAASDDFAGFAGSEFGFTTSDELAERLVGLLSLAPDRKDDARRKLEALAERHSLPRLAGELVGELQAS